jgi:hypothetical protein
MAQNFQFQEEDSIAMKKRGGKSAPGIAGLFIKWGLAKTPAQANLWMIAITIVCFAVIIYQQLY